MRKFQKWINESKGKLSVPEDLDSASLEEKIQQNEVRLKRMDVRKLEQGL